MARSRYERINIVDGNQYESFSLEQTNRFKEPDTFDGVDYIEYTSKVGDRLDHLAAKYLNDDEYWWMIALLNNLTNPFITPGTVLRIPTDSRQMLDRI